MLRRHSISRNARAAALLDSAWCTRRSESTALHFYQNRQLELYASKEAKPVTLRQLIFFGRSTLEKPRLITSANYVRTELPIRIAHRLRDLQTLPYVVVTQEGVARVYELYWLAFEKFRRYPIIQTLEDNDKFCTFLRQILNEHATVIPNLYLGLSLSSPHLPPDQLDSFMRRMLTSRISRRVLAEHHLALSAAYNNGQGPYSPKHDVGIISTELDVHASVQRCITLLRSRYLPGNQEWPQIIADGHLGTKFAYIKEHLEYIVFELLKNSLYATRLHHPDARPPPPITITIAEGVNDVSIRVSDQGGGLSLSNLQISSPADLFSFSHVKNATRLQTSRLGALRTVISEPDGLKATVNEQVARWRQRNDSDVNGDEHAGAGYVEQRIGIGLPMSHIFSTYFGGTLGLMSLDGWGTDAYLRLPKLGTNLEGIEV